MSSTDAEPTKAEDAPGPEPGAADPAKESSEAARDAASGASGAGADESDSGAKLTTSSKGGGDETATEGSGSGAADGESKADPEGDSSQEKEYNAPEESDKSSNDDGKAAPSAEGSLVASEDGAKDDSKEGPSPVADESKEEGDGSPAKEKPEGVSSSASSGAGSGSAAEPPKDSGAASGASTAGAADHSGVLASLADTSDDTIKKLVYRMPPVSVKGHVVMFGWCWKQGEAGLFTRASWKRRFMVLYRVPQGAFLLYYAKQGTNPEDLKGHIDLRRVDKDGIRIGNERQEVNGVQRKVVEVVTPERTFLLYPESVNYPYSRVPSEDNPRQPSFTFILAWPVEEPAAKADGGMLDGAKGGRTGEQVQAAWLRALRCVQAGEQISITRPATVVRDATSTVPDELLLRVGPTDVSVLAPEDPDRCINTWDYKSIAGWSAPMEGRLGLTVRGVGGKQRLEVDIKGAQELKDMMTSHMKRLKEALKANAELRAAHAAGAAHAELLGVEASLIDLGLNDGSGGGGSGRGRGGGAAKGGAGNGSPAAGEDEEAETS